MPGDFRAFGKAALAIDESPWFPLNTGARGTSVSISGLSWI